MASVGVVQLLAHILKFTYTKSEALECAVKLFPLSSRHDAVLPAVQAGYHYLTNSFLYLRGHLNQVERDELRLESLTFALWSVRTVIVLSATRRFDRNLALWLADREMRELSSGQVQLFCIQSKGIYERLTSRMDDVPDVEIKKMPGNANIPVLSEHHADLFVGNSMMPKDFYKNTFFRVRTVLQDCSIISAARLLNDFK